MKGLSSKILILVSPIVLFVLVGSLVYASEVTIKAGTPIPLKLLDDFNVSLQFLAHRNAHSLWT